MNPNSHLTVLINSIIFYYYRTNWKLELYCLSLIFRHFIWKYNFRMLISRLVVLTQHWIHEDFLTVIDFQVVTGILSSSNS